MGSLCSKTIEVLPNSQPPCQINPIPLLLNPVDSNQKCDDLQNSNSQPEPVKEEKKEPAQIDSNVADEVIENKPEDEKVQFNLPNNDDNQDILSRQKSCNNEHQFQWKQDLVYSFMIANGLDQKPILITCAQCNAMFSKASWQCTACDLIICNNCGESQSLNRPMIKCTRGHEPKWSVDSWAYPLEKKKTTRPVIICSICRKSLQEPAYTCRSCYYNSCIQCSKAKGVIPPINILVCCDENPLVLTSITGQQCNLCNNPITDFGYACSSCNSYNCKNCVIAKSLKMIRHAGLRCTENHPSMCLNDCKRSGIKEKQSCINCGGSVLNFGLFCVYCAERCCLECADKIQDLLEICIGKKLDETNYIKWYKYIDYQTDQVLNCGTCRHEITDGIYFEDNLDQPHCTECVSSKN